jgi:hypothetical protein
MLISLTPSAAARKTLTFARAPGTQRSLLGRNTAFCSILALPSRGLEQNPQRPCDRASLHRALTSNAADREAKSSVDAGADGEFAFHPN